MLSQATHHPYLTLPDFFCRTRTMGTPGSRCLSGWRAPRWARTQTPTRAGPCLWCVLSGRLRRGGQPPRPEWFAVQHCPNTCCNGPAVASTWAARAASSTSSILCITRCPPQLCPALTLLNLLPPAPPQDEVSCIGCKQCVWAAPATFRIEDTYGRSRVFAQVSRLALPVTGLKGLPAAGEG